MALAHAARSVARGVTKPRLAPPTPARSRITDYEAAAAELGIVLMPWQRIAARYMTATNGKRWHFREFAGVVSRQNGKTELLLPRILMGLHDGRRMLHTAHNRSLPRETFLRLAVALNGHPDVTEIRFANGQEVIRFANGGRYTLVAPRPRVRGNAVDDVFIDEIREMRSFELMAAIKPTLTASKNPQIIYLSNAGDSGSVVLNDLRLRADSDPDLAYLEWSADPTRAIDDRRGWAEANPALGITVQEDTLAHFFATFPGPVFETEHLCRWVVSMQPRLVDEASWLKSRSITETPRRPVMAVSMDVGGRRASADIAWLQADGSIGLEVVADETGDPLDVDRIGREWAQLAARLRVREVGFDPLTDAALARHIRTAKPLHGREFANASENFVRLVESGRIHWQAAGQVTDDLAWTSRKAHAAGEWHAVKAQEDRPITSALAAVRAVWMASAPRIAGNARIR